MQLYYSESISGDICKLDQNEANHCLRVMRMKKGEKLQVTDGKGFLYDCTIISENVNDCELKINEKINKSGTEQSSIQIAVALTKNPSRFEWFVEKAVEIGIHRIIPIECKNSEKVTFKRDRIHKLAIAAMKQSLRTRLPIIEDIKKLDQLLITSNNQYKCIATMNHPQNTGLHQLYSNPGDILIVIGPEGDFSDAETNLALNHNFKPITLGDFRLRTETAALYACMTVNLINQFSNPH